MTALEDIKGQMTAKRALTIAWAGNHTIMLAGPRGTGKASLASAFFMTHATIMDTCACGNSGSVGKLCTCNERFLTRWRLRFLREAAADPDVLAIKQTLYRAGRQSSIINSLEAAAESGKRVTVLVELKARFDEENNIEWAKRLEAAGVSVIYGVAGFKTHAKAALVVRREPDGIRRYVHLGTGNYNEKTARLYCDLGLFTSREDYASDISAFFNMVTGYSQPADWAKVEVAPYGLRRRLLRLISREAMT